MWKSLQRSCPLLLARHISSLARKLSQANGMTTWKEWISASPRARFSISEMFFGETRSLAKLFHDFFLTLGLSVRLNVEYIFLILLRSTTLSSKHDASSFKFSCDQMKRYTRMFNENLTCDLTIKSNLRDLIINNFIIDFSLYLSHCDIIFVL